MPKSYVHDLEFHSKEEIDCKYIHIFIKAQRASLNLWWMIPLWLISPWLNHLFRSRTILCPLCWALKSCFYDSTFQELQANTTMHIHHLMTARSRQGYHGYSHQPNIKEWAFMSSQTKWLSSESCHGFRCITRSVGKLSCVICVCELFRSMYKPRNIHDSVR